jgi:hypothetical protein
VNNKLLADEMSRRVNLDVYVPDFFNGELYYMLS